MLRPVLGPFLAPLVALALVLPGCTGERFLPAPPEASYKDARIPGYQDIRYWGDIRPPNARAQLGQIRKQIVARAKTDGHLPNGGRFDVLVLSGGGSDGAYGAGLLKGWSDRGDRPEFGLVTGISTGALIAPFAFLGPAYDDELERLYTSTSTEQLVNFIVLKALFGWALGLTDVTQLAVTLDRVLTSEMIRRIAEEHAKGRRLWVGTTDLDAQRPVIWDIGAIAASDRSNKKSLIRDVLLASAAIPGAFPPVQFTVQADGHFYSEMHVDGGVTRQLFLYPGGLRLSDEPEDRLTGMRLGTIYTIRNTQLAPVYQPVDPSILAIAQRSVSTLIKSSGVSDVRTIEEQARRDGWAMKRTAVPADFDGTETELFDPAYMRALFEVGYRRAVEGTAWESVVEQDPGRTGRTTQAGRGS